MGAPRLRSRLCGWVVALGAGGFLLLGCADEQAGPQFATDPRPPAASPTAAPALPGASRRLPTNVALATPLAPADLLVPRGAPDRLYYPRDGAVWTLVPASGETAPVWRPARDRVLAGVASSPSGDRVAIVTSGTGDDAASSLELLDPSGEVVRRVDDLDRAVGSDLAQPAFVQWSPQGERLLVGFRDGAVVSFPIDADRPPSVLVPAGDPRRPVAAAWSPTGEEIAFVGGAEAEPAALFRVPAAGTPGPAVAVAPSPAAGGAIGRFAWLPDGRGLLFTQEGGGIGSGSVDLWAAAVDGSDRRLVASAGIAGPIARIALFAPSIDGQSVAYTVDVPSDGGERFHSLWVRDLASGQNLQIPVPAGGDVTQLWWTSAGLVFAVLEQTGTPTPSGQTTALLLAASDGPPVELVRFGTAAGSPVPGATPRAPTGAASGEGA